MNSLAGKDPNVTATAPCSRAPPGVEQAAYDGLSSVQSCALRPPASLSSQVDTTLLPRLAILDPTLHDLQGTSLRLLSKGDISDCCAAANLHNVSLNPGKHTTSLPETTELSWTRSLHHHLPIELLNL